MVVVGVVPYFYSDCPWPCCASEIETKKLINFARLQFLNDKIYSHMKKKQPALGILAKLVFYRSILSMKNWIFAKLQFSWEKNLREQDNFFPRKSGPRSIFQKWTIVQFHFTFCIFFHIEESFIELWFIDPEILNFGLNCDGVKLLLPLLQGIDPLGSRMCFLLCTPTPLEWLARALQDFQPRRGTIWGKGITFKKKAQWNQVFFEVIFELFLIQ